MIKKILTSALLAVAMLASAQEVVRYGYAPEEMAEVYTVYQGQGANGFIAGAICLDPQTDPVVARLEGHQIKGVRCFLHHDYKQARQKRSMILHTDNLEGELTTKNCDFVQGWNEIYFDEPITIGTTPVYVGLQVYESGSVSHPLVSYGGASVSGACWINLNKEGWESYSNRGTLLIQAILDDEAAPIVDNMVYAQVATSPQAIAPASSYEGEVYFNNHTNKAINSVELLMLGQGDDAPHVVDVQFDSPLAAKEGRNLPMDIYTGSESGVNQWIKLTVTKINGEPTQEARPGITYHYLTQDDYTRVSIVEEFTSQRCINCPFMIYFLDKAIHQHDKEIVYITHHTGYQADFFTKSGEDAILYLFGEEPHVNPAVMYDRRVLPGKMTPINKASVAETTPYTEALNYVTALMAMAEVNIDVNYDKEAGTVGCTVSGRVNSEMVAEGVDAYITVCLVEDSIPVSDKYFQQGLVEEEGAPEDLIESFRHNGVKRHVYTEHTGDLLTMISDNNYSVTFDPVAINPECNIDNCRIVAYVHKVDMNDVSQNEVLNAAQKWLNDNTSIENIEAKDNQVRFVVNNNRSITIEGEVESYRIYNVHGQYIPNNATLMPGVYLVTYKTPQGVSGNTKLLIY